MTNYGTPGEPGQQGYGPGSYYGQQPYGGGPSASDPYASGPYASGPYAAGPYASGPYASGPYGQWGHPYAQQPPPPAPPRRTGRRWLMAAGGGIVAAGLVVAGVATATTGSTSIAGLGSSVPGSSSSAPSTPGGSSSSGSTGQTAKTSGTASSTQQTGIVTIVSVLKYQSAESAGTGMILTSDGEILTNNHVINGATSVTVTVETTGKSYRADVVGTSPTQDVAVLQLRDASGLQTAKLADDASDVQVGDQVIGVGNAGGTGTLTAAGGKVTALDQSITASSENGSDAEQLHQLIETDAPIISGDSGGPLYDSAGDIVGINTAASSQRARQVNATSAAYAIPIQNATAIADKIESGQQSTTIHIGAPGFLGVGTADAQGGVGIQSVLRGGPADDAGITSGSIVTAIDGQAVSSADALKTLLSGKDPGDQVKISWTGADGQSHTATVTLVAGPAD